MPTLAAPLWLAREFLLALLLLLCCGGPGQPLVGRLPGLGRTERRVLGAVAGMAVLSFGLGLLAIAGLFRPASILALLAISQLGWRWRSREGASNPPGAKPVLVVLAAALPAALLLAPYPAAAFDDTLYHLPIARGLIDVGLFFVVALAVSAALLLVRKTANLPGPRGGPYSGADTTQRRAASAALASLVVAASIVALPWYARNVVLTGNPVSPFLSGVFGDSAWRMEGAALAGREGGSLADPSCPGWAGAGRVAVAMALDLVRSPLLLLEDSVRPRSVPPLSPFAAIALPVGAAMAWASKGTRLAVRDRSRLSRVVGPQPA